MNEYSSSSSSNSLYTLVVTCYNQEGFIIECLESIKEQEYEPVELIICDDRSSDNSVEAIQKWLEENEQRFVRSKLIVNEVNLGIAGNHNVGLAKANGKFISFIHGDDKLYDKSALTNAVVFIQAERLKFCSLRIRAFLDRGNGDYELQELLPSDKVIPLFKMTPKKQYKSLLTSCWVPGVLIIETEFLRTIGGFDEEFRSAEDWSLWLLLTRKGHQIRILEEPFLLYRRHPNSITISSINKGISDFSKNKLKAIEKYIFPYSEFLSIYDRWSVFVYYRYLQSFIKHGCTREASKKARWIKLLDPISLFKSRFL